MDPFSFSQLYAEYQILNNCLATSYEMKDRAMRTIANDKADIQAQTLLQKAQHDIDELSEPVANLWAKMQLILEKKYKFKRLQNPLYAIKDKQLRNNNLNISK